MHVSIHRRRVHAESTSERYTCKCTDEHGNFHNGNSHSCTFVHASVPMEFFRSYLLITKLAYN